MSVSVDNFLKNVYLLSQERTVSATTSNLAVRLNISASAVTDMARKLGRKGLLDYKPYQMLVLSEAGRRKALNVVRKHRLWELFLYEVLNMDLMSVHEEAEKLEHNTSDDLAGRLADFLGQPEFDPHGDPIPDPTGELPSERGVVSLAEAEPGKIYEIKKLRYRDNEIKEMYDRYGLQQGITLTITRKFNFDGSVELNVGLKNSFVISKNLATNIFVTRTK